MAASPGRPIGLLLLTVALLAAPFVVMRLFHSSPAGEPAAVAVPPAPPAAPVEESEDRPEPVEGDSWSRVSAVVRRNVELDPVLRDFDILIVAREPFLLCVSRDGIPDAEAVAAKALDLLEAIYVEVLEKLGPPLGLRPLSELPTDDMKVCRVLLLAGDAFERYHEKAELAVSNRAQVYYGGRARWLTIRLPPPREEDRLGSRAFSLVVYQLLHVWWKAAREAWLGEPVAWTDPRLEIRLEFLTTGLPLFLGSGRERPDGTFEFGAMDRRSLSEWADARSAGRKEWPLAQLLDVATYAELRQRAACRPGIGDSDLHENLFIAQSVAFCHFLWHFGDGKYRPKLLELMKPELGGVSGPDAFRAAFGLAPGDEALEPLAAEFAAYVEKPLAELRR